jgi:RNA polymerase sigma-70 factor (ECF subfamily)
MPPFSIPNERDIVGRARCGDKKAYRLLVEACQDRLFGYVVGMVRQQETAEDLLQEIFVKAYFALGSFAGDSGFYTWIFRIASNHCLDYFRKKRVQTVSLDTPRADEENLVPLDSMAAPSNELPDSGLGQDREAVSLLDALTPEQREILILREVEGYSYEEMAKLQNCATNTIKSRLNRAREALRIAFESRYGNISGTDFVKNKRRKP